MGICDKSKSRWIERRTEIQLNLYENFVNWQKNKRMNEQEEIKKPLSEENVECLHAMMTGEMDNARDVYWYIRMDFFKDE